MRAATWFGRVRVGVPVMCVASAGAVDATAKVDPTIHRVKTLYTFFVILSGMHPLGAWVARSYLIPDEGVPI